MIKLLQTLLEGDSVPPQPKRITVPHQDSTILDELQLDRHNCVIAGGCPLLWYQGLPVGKHDIDLWFKNESDITAVKNHLLTTHLSSRVMFETHNAITIECDSVENRTLTWRIQLIKRTFTTVEQLLDSFDVTVTKIATDGHRWFLGEHFAEDLRDRRLRMMKYNASAVRRALKYVTYGYTPDPELIDRIISDPVATWDFSDQYGIDEYENAF